MKIIISLKKKLKIAFKSSILCLKFPFLYPRNRFTGKNHVYYNWIGHLKQKFYTKAYEEIILGYRYYKDPSKCIEQNKSVLINNTFKITLQDGTLYIEGGIHPTTFNLQKHVGKSFEISGITLGQKTLLGTPIILYHVYRKERTDINYGFAHSKIIVTKSKFYKYLDKLIWWFWTQVLDRICIIPISTELDFMPEGWRKAFGIQLCKELRTQLIKEHKLFSYRILQIKEKYGYLHWYDNHYSVGISNILEKYEKISYRTCISCGKPAKYLSSGWISPYCEKCFNGRVYAVLENNNWKYVG